uniref:SUN domaincontaining protein 1like [Aplysia californica] n=1 Tax=Lepeophtheirus salmonis TaxID=72036 RepID=A0A0K2TKA9_LEPSM
MEDDEQIYLRLPPENKKQSNRRVLRSSCVGSKCLCASKGLKHHVESVEVDDHREGYSLNSEKESDPVVKYSSSLSSVSINPSSSFLERSFPSSTEQISKQSSTSRTVRSFSSADSASKLESSRNFQFDQHPGLSLRFSNTQGIPQSSTSFTSRSHETLLTSSSPSTSTFAEGGVSSHSSTFVSNSIKGNKDFPALGSYFSKYRSLNVSGNSDEDDNFGAAIDSRKDRTRALKNSSSFSKDTDNLRTLTDSRKTSIDSTKESSRAFEKSSSFSKDYSPDTSSFSDSLDSPRHRIFKDFQSWINSPRTGYTYAESETYGSETESKYEVQMPHMARNPICRGGNVINKSSKNVSFQVKSEKKSSFSTVKLLRKIFYDIPASFLIFDTKLLLKSPKNIIIRTLLSIWTLLIVYPIESIGSAFKSSLNVCKRMIGGTDEVYTITEQAQSFKTAKANTYHRAMSFKTLVQLRQKLASASKEYRLKKLKAKTEKIHQKNISQSTSTRRSRRLRGIPAEKLELPKKWKRRINKRKTAIKEVKAVDKHLFADVWYSFLSLFSLSSYVDDDDSEFESDSSGSEDEVVLSQKKAYTTRTKSKKSSLINGIFYMFALMLNYLWKPFEFVENIYHRMRMSLTKKIYYLYDHENIEFDDSDSDVEDEEEDDEDDIEEFMEKRYFIQDIVIYLISLGRPPPSSRTCVKRKQTYYEKSNISHSNLIKPEKTKISRKRYVESKSTLNDADFSDSDESESGFLHNKIQSKSAHTIHSSSSLMSKIRKYIASLFERESSNNSRSSSLFKEIKVPEIIVTSDEDIVSVVQKPKLCFSSKSNTSKWTVIKNNTETITSWKEGFTYLLLFPWNLMSSSCRFLLNEFQLWKTLASKDENSYVQKESSYTLCNICSYVLKGLRNTGLILASGFIYMCIPFVRAGRRVYDVLFMTKEDEVDRIPNELNELSNYEEKDEGFDSLSEEELERKIFDNNMKIFSSQLHEVAPNEKRSKRKGGGITCSKLIPFMVFLSILLFFICPTLNTLNSADSIKLMEVKSHEYLDAAKVMKDKVQAKGASMWTHFISELWESSEWSTFIHDKLSSTSKSFSNAMYVFSRGLSDYENYLRQHLSNALYFGKGSAEVLANRLINFFNYIWDILVNISARLKKLSSHYYDEMAEFISISGQKIDEYSTSSFSSIKGALFCIPLYFSNIYENSSNRIKSSYPKLFETSKRSNEAGISPTQTIQKYTLEANNAKSSLSTSDYDIIVEKIISNEKFQELAKQNTLSEDDNEILKSSRNDILKVVNNQEETIQKDYLELKELLIQQKKTMDVHQDNYEAWKKDIENIFQNLKTEFQSLSSEGADAGNVDSSILLKELQSKISALEENSMKLFNLSTNCCKSIESLDIKGDVKNYFESSSGEELLAWMNKRFISQDENNQRLEKLKSDLIVKLEALQSQGSGSSYVTIESIHRVVQEALIRYDADKTGKFDYALESAGGSVISTRCTETYVKKTALYTLLGLPLWYPSNNPRTAIQPGVHPGECWAFKGSEGFLVINLSNTIIPESFSIEHIPKSMSPTGNIDSAPKDFLVLGLKTEKDPEPVNLGKYTYSSTGDPLQTFNIENPAELSFDIIELNILSNHGNVNFTCLYRFRVHGSPIHS